MHIHLLDMLEQCLGFLPYGDALPAAVEKFDREQGFELANSAGDGRMIELEPL